MAQQILAGLFLAGAGVFLSHYFNDSRINGVASILIGVLWAFVWLLKAEAY